MHDMIRRQHVSVSGTLAALPERAAKVPKPSGPVLCVGIGTSFHAALAGSRAFLEVPGFSQKVEPVAAFDILDDPSRLDGVSAAVVYSSAGETWVTLEAQRELKRRNIQVILISAREESPSSALADHVLPTSYADEASWTHTVSYSSAVAASSVLARAWGAPADGEADNHLLDSVQAALAMESSIIDLVDATTSRDRFVLVGSECAEATAREGALKIREAYGQFATATGVEELLHGVLPSVNERTFVLAFAATDLERRRAADGLRAARELGAATSLVHTLGGPTEEGVFGLPAVPPSLSPIPQVIPVQFLAYWAAVGIGRNPDVMGLDDPLVLAARRSFGI